MPLHYQRVKLAVNLLPSKAQNPSLPSFNLLIKSNSTLHHTLSDTIPLLPSHYIRFPLLITFSEPPPWILLYPSPNIRLDLLKYHKALDTSINTHFNFMLEEYPAFIKCFTDGSEIRTKSACSFSMNSIQLRLHPHLQINRYVRLGALQKFPTL